MDERAALALLERHLDPVGDDAAIVDDLVITTDMLHERTDFPAGTTRYTAGWRSVGASLSDVAAMGASATAAVAAYAAPEFDADDLEAFVDGANDVCDAVNAAYVGGDLDTHQEFTVATTAVGETTAPVLRRGATPGDVVCVTGSLGRSAAALDHFDADNIERANELFRFEPRVRAGRELADVATAMMDSSDGLARSLHQLAEASDCGFAIEGASIPVASALEDALSETGATDAEILERAISFGEDFELVCTIPESAVEAAREAIDTELTVVGAVVDAGKGITLDGAKLADRGYTHGG
ncbi:thiamine-phosphate kinase [Natronosalvus vescus]|uniref:thiamine-phosphate kinase n=1 Tax=Natronosalvus vescus TaxID=2953881 RepID=UPI0020909DED|nr:thiamine-phosphate kinase [Natronosalvus vescus]